MKKILVFCLGLFVLTAAGTASAGDAAKWIIGTAIVGKAIEHNRDTAKRVLIGAAGGALVGKAIGNNSGAMRAGAAIGALAGFEAQQSARYGYTTRAQYYAPGYAVRYYHTPPPRYYYRQHSRPRVNIHIRIR